MMERVIKFRALLSDGIESWWEYYTPLDQPAWLDLPSGYTIRVRDLQFTGLFDKNGKEIYEGDILQYIGYKCHSCGQHVLYPDHKPYVITWNQNHCCWECLEYGEDDPNWMSPDIWGTEMLVIGNIYENPSLLKGNE